MDLYATVSWNVEDIMSIRPQMSEDEAAEFLDMNEGTIQEMMISRGWDAIEMLLSNRIVVGHGKQED